MSLNNAQAQERNPRLTSFFIKDILASNEHEHSYGNTLSEEFSSSDGSQSNPRMESEQDVSKRFAFPDSCAGHSQKTSAIGHEESTRLHQDRSVTTSEKNPPRNRFEQNASTGKFARVLCKKELFTYLYTVSYSKHSATEI